MNYFQMSRTIELLANINFETIIFLKVVHAKIGPARYFLWFYSFLTNSDKNVWIIYIEVSQVMLIPLTAVYRENPWTAENTLSL